MFDIDKITKLLVEVQPIHKDEKVVEAFNFLMTNKNWGLVLANPNCPNKVIGEDMESEN